jgi:hypothetical protein
MGDRAKGKDKGKANKKAKAVKPGKRPHEQQQQARTMAGPPAAIKPVADKSERP